MMNRSIREALRLLAMLAVGVALGLGFGLETQSPDAPLLQSVPTVGSSPPERVSSGMPAPRARPTAFGQPENSTTSPVHRGAVGALSVAIESLARVEIPAFAARRGNPWKESQSRFVLTREVRDLLQIDAQTADKIRNSLDQLREEVMQPSWQNPTRVRGTEQGVELSIAPSPAATRERIREEIDQYLGSERTMLLMQYAGETFDWEFGGFGRLERVLEVTTLSDDSLSIRETLRPVPDSDDGSHSANERSVNQYRIEDIPDALSRFVQVGDPQ